MTKIISKLMISAMLGMSFGYTAAATVGSTYAYLRNDTLTIGNDKIERNMLWNHGCLKTVNIIDKTSGRIWSNNSIFPDLYVTEEGPTRDGKFSESIVEGTVGLTGYHKVTVEYSLGDMDVRKEFRIYENCPAIACDVYFKGDGSSFFKGGLSVNPADLKNIESIDDMKLEMEHPILDHIQPGGKHWAMKAVEFFDVTDMCNNLVAERSFIPFRKAFYRGNLLFAHNKDEKAGLFFLKEAPCSMVQLAYRDADFCIEFDRFSVIGCGLDGKDIKKDDWTRGYGCVTGVYTGNELESLTALRNYQKNIRGVAAQHDEMIMMNTWGDRGQDTKVNERFCIAELEAGSRLGITHFQIDDGWQSGRTPNSATAGGSFKDIWTNPDYWTPNPSKYPNGLQPVADCANRLGIALGLWFNPSVQDAYADWEKDADTLIGLYKKYGIKFFKIDGLQIPDKESEENLRKLFDKVRANSGDTVLFNLDVTAGRRGGYNMLNEYGNFFVENRYTDWGIYFPYWTLRNLWQLSKYVPAEKLQTVFLNKWRNQDVYGNDRFAPVNYDFEYLFATTMAGQPLAWFEGTGLPEEAFMLKPIVEKYKEIRHDFHNGVILPIGDEPSGESWTGFQSIGDNKGYLLVYREDNDKAEIQLPTWLPSGQTATFEPILGKGTVNSCTIGEDGLIMVNIPEKNSYLLCRYELD